MQPFGDVFILTDEDNMKRTLTFTTLLLAALLLAGCATDAAPPATESQPTPADEQPTQVPPASESAPPEASALPTTPLEPTEAGLGPIPEGSQQLRASDPSSVQLAAGEPTLVEFFAFW